MPTSQLDKIQRIASDILPEAESQNKKDIIIIDDNFGIRQAVMSIVLNYLPKSSVNFLTSSNGLEGLGLVISSNPSLIIIDATLPKYSGRELVDYLVSNHQLVHHHMDVIVLYNRVMEKYFPDNYYLLNKDDKDFSKNLQKTLALILRKYPQDTYRNYIWRFLFKIRTFFIDKVIRLSVLSDNLIENAANNFIFFRFFKSIFWFFLQGIKSILLSFIFILGGMGSEGNVDQIRTDFLEYRVRYYPTLISAILVGFFFTIQVLIYMFGGIEIMGVRINSLFAMYGRGTPINFDDAIYDPSFISVSEGSIGLKGCSVQDDIESNIVNYDSGLLVVGSSEDAQLNSEQTNLIFSSDVSNRILYPRDAVDQYSSIYCTNSPFIIFREPMKYSPDLVLLEDSSLNNDQTSLAEANTGIEEKSYQSSISYQISPNLEDWYYYETDTGWINVAVDSISSNTVQQLNQYLAYWDPQLGQNIYLKMFLNTSGYYALSVDSLLWKNNGDLIEDASSEPRVCDGSIVSDFTETSVVIDQYLKDYNGIKINGRAEFNIGDYPTSRDRSSISVQLVNSNDLRWNDPEFKYSDVEIIKDLELTYNGGVYYFSYESSKSLNVPVSAVLYCSSCNDSVLNVSPAIGVGTIVVNLTSDEGDANLNDGYCDVKVNKIGNQCTLRAAIEQTNYNSNILNIYFAISKTDPGYRDIDSAGVAYSGDNVGGDDYWTIAPSEQLPVITAPNLFISGNYLDQDSNVYGPDFEISGHNLQDSIGLRFSTNAVNVTLDGLTINGFGSGRGGNRAGIYVASSDFTLKNSYLGTEVNGLSLDSNFQDIIAVGTDNLYVGHDINTGNIIASPIGISLYCNSNTTGVSFIGNNFCSVCDKNPSIYSWGYGFVVHGDCNLDLRDNISISSGK
ncbi:response regulator [Candidatus Dojkabacteria bacterium]|nr:response regulator [Candidatus Dojkabacteria bacterium]